MLKLEKMKVSGFKSFGDRTELRFLDGITAVVGPNGCGKSNIGDAINWVLGEQSPKSLRGARMKDVIFNGSKSRKPKGMAEVSLHMTSDNGAVADDGQRAVITRRLFRSGESEYLLNGRKVRLRDIQELLLAEHVGAKTYATIEQGRIDQILNSKPKDRRGIIEDAAGVSGFKHKRRLARLKLEATQANLLRVSDIVAEVRKQINSIKRQASKARRYKKLRGEIREKETIRFGLKARSMDADLARIREEERRHREAEASASAALATRDAGLAEARHALEEEDRKFREASESLHQLDLEIDRAESRINHCREKIADATQGSRSAAEGMESLASRVAEVRDRIKAHGETVAAGARDVRALEEELAAAQEEVEEAGRWVSSLRSRIEEVRQSLFSSMNLAAERRNNVRSLEEALERNRADQSRLRGEQAEVNESSTKLVSETRTLEEMVSSNLETIEKLRSELHRDEQELVEARDSVAAGMEELASAREREHSADARLGTLEDLATRFAEQSDGVRVLLGDSAPAGLRTLGVVADYVEAGRDIEGVADTYLREVLPTVILEDESDARRAADLLNAEGIGRTTFLCRDHPAGGTAVGAPANGSPPVPVEIMSDPRVIGRLHDGLTLRTQMNGALQERIGDAVLVDDLEAALDLHRRYSRADYITRSGEVVYASGLIAAGGKQSSRHGLLSHNRQVMETRAVLETARSEIAVVEERLAVKRDEVAALEKRIAGTRERLEETGRRRVELELKMQRSTEDRERAGRRTEVLSSELDNLAEEANRIHSALATAVAEVSGHEEAHQELENRLSVENAALAEAEEKLRARSEASGVLRARLAARRQQQESEIGEQERLEELAREQKERMDALRAEHDAARKRAEESAALMASTEAVLTGQLRDREERAAGLKGVEEKLAEMRADLASSEKELSGFRSDFEEMREKSRASEMELARAEADRKHLDDLAFGELGVDAGQAESDAGEALESADLAEIAAELAEIRARLERIGPVNMMAIDEFSELEERYTFLSSQKEDLEKSIASLEETIRKINRTSRERFITAFETIRTNYKEIFALLFNGGRADLSLMEGEDVLESGIEILAQPPGKRLQSVQLLSGGEKALSAIALLFAIFRYRPSPFCLLDEVDAALDDVNVGRFTRMLEEYAKQSQFILITHNKVSMESANLIYGVTMEDPGVSRVMSLQLG